MYDCIFCKIINKEINGYIIDENDDAICFLDVNPISRGHCLVVPKKHYKDIFNIDQKSLKGIIELAQKVSNMIIANLGATGVNLLNANGKDAQQSVFHFHVHIVPRFSDDELDTWPKSDYKEKSLSEVFNRIRL